MKQYITEQEIDNCLNDCIDLVKETRKPPHIISLYRGSLPLGVKLSNYLNAPLSIVDYQSYDGESKKPKLMKNAGIKKDDLLVVVDDICDQGLTLNITEEYLKAWFPNNSILIYTIVGSMKHPEHYHYSIEHNNEWVVFPWETITDTRCKICSNGEPCREKQATHTHCNIKNKSFKNYDTCSEFQI